jgi:TRAP-type C4-dicarboxylate transport system substrate-binding protein
MIPDYLITSPGTFDRMSAEDQAIFSEELQAAFTESSELTTQIMEDSQVAAEEAGAEFNEPDIALFREAVAPLADEKLTTDTARQVYDAVRAAAE